MLCENNLREKSIKYLSSWETNSHEKGTLSYNHGIIMIYDLVLSVCDIWSIPVLFSHNSRFFFPKMEKIT